MDLQAGWDGTWQEFLTIDKASFIQKLVIFHKDLDWTQELDPMQRFAWEIEFDVMQSTLNYVVGEVKVSLSQCWISFEQELIGEGGKRAADVNLVIPSGELFIIEFKHKVEASEHEILRTNSDLQTMLRYHSESIDLTGHGFLVLTKPNAREFKHQRIVCEIAEQGMMPQLASQLITSLAKPNVYDPLRWAEGTFYRQPSILHGTAQVFFDAKIPTLKTTASENIEDARKGLLELYKHAKRKLQRYVVVVHGRPGAGKTLLGVSTVADIARSHSEHESEPVFLSGNAPLVQVLQHTLDYYGKHRTKHEAEQVIDGKIMIQDLHVFKKQIKRSLDSRKETFVVFDEAQRAWDKATPGNRQSPSELMLFCNWLSQLPFGVLVLLVGDGQAIHRNEMQLEQMLSDLDFSIKAQNGNVVAIMPSLHADKMRLINPIKRDAFNLKTPIRQSYTESLDKWIEAVLSNNSDLANEIAKSIQSDYPLRVTQNKENAEHYANDLQHTFHEGNCRPDAFRSGWLMSSQGGKFIEEVQKDKFKPGKHIGPWYVEPPSSDNSCCRFDATCTEFSCQGLELSLALFNWGQDLVYRNGQLILSLDKNNRRQHDHYTEGSYRVLLSRGRSGLIVKCDDDETFAYLNACGMEVI
ncbi:MAG: DNA/RNA helicase domain-containing protein [Photobacterium frigidiphilum]|uniref:DNA/RNA helicase domain-containing protein n=1 Tax=Photobacterium frigidiphilum TaxID=264736 RepID=UPI0030039041